jgi:RNA polymerase sigma-54 factor
MLNQRLQQKLLQKLSPQQILLMKLLQIPSMALEQRIKQEIEENPALDEQDDSIDQEEQEIDEAGNEDNPDLEEENTKEDEFDFEDYLDEDEIPSYKLASNNSSADQDRKDIPFSSGTTFQEFLTSQLGLRPLDEKQKQIGEYIIGNLDDSGYLHRDLNAMIDDLAFTQNIEATKDEILEVLIVLQDFDPAGVGARNLQECLLIQLNREDSNGDKTKKNARLILDRYFNEFTKKHYDKIIKKAEISQEELKEALEVILKLNPKPGNSLSDTTKSNHYIIPDFVIFNNTGELELTLNSRNAPELRLSRSYMDMLQAYSENKKDKRQKDAYMFVKQKIDSAKWFIDAIRQRQNTLLITMKTIMEYQYQYFLTGDERELRPMILKDIAEIVHLGISTVSRVANSKYVQTPFGTFLLKSFFSESMQTSEGEEVSTREIKSILSETIENESKKKPFTDEQLTKTLIEKGYNIARRTVAKYREQLNIPVARLRKEL